jgi:hypothetical protein
MRSSETCCNYSICAAQVTLRTALENGGQVSEDDEERMMRLVTSILHALHAAHPVKLTSLLAPARSALPAVERLLAAVCLPEK